MNDEPAKAVSPASSGPAGSEFEAQVGASYLLSMLVGGEPLGLPGTRVDSVKFQRAGEGHPLDDVVVHSHDLLGEAAILEIQVKRSISFSPSDNIFKSVVAQMVEAARKPGFWASKHELAVATARTSRKVPDAVDLFRAWSLAFLGADPLTPRLLARLHHWLTEIESAQEARYSRDVKPYFGDALTPGQIRSLLDELRHGFALFANRVPELAAEYLRTAKARKGHEQIAAALHEFRGTLAAAAPDELADLLESALIPTPCPDDLPRHLRRSYIDNVFTHFDSKFLPVSPVQGPFYELLNANPETGKRLIRRLIDYAISQVRHSDDEPDAIEITNQPPTEWNDAYFNLMAACLPGLPVIEVDAFALGLIHSLSSPDVFFSVSARLLRSLDAIYLDTDSIDPMVVVHVRQSIVDELRKRYAWNRFARDQSESVERNIGDLVSAFFFHIYNFGFTPPRCYLPPSRVFKTYTLLPTLQALAIEAPSPLIAVETMNMLEVAPGIEQLSFAIAVVKAWASERQDDPVFWVDHAIGRRFCQWLERVRVIEPTCMLSNNPVRKDIDQILAALVRSGVPEARRFETLLSNL